jgi:hypothetical protein
MYSGRNTLTGGFPHSDIRGSSIARISPQLIAACHVLHRLLAPRHPPNALIALNNHHHPHAGPRTASQQTPSQRPRTAACQKPAQPLSLTQSNQSDSPVKQHAPRPTPHHRAPRPSGKSVMQRSHPKGQAVQTQQHALETVGIEPTTPCLQSRCSPTELRPLTSNRPGAAAEWAREDLNLRPHAYQACALTN